MHPQDRSAPVHHRAHRGQGAGQPLGRRTLGDHADEVLARQGQQQRPAQRPHLVEPAQDLHGLGGRLREVHPGVEHELVVSDAAATRLGGALGEESDGE